MSKITDFLDMAAEYAIKDDIRTFLIGAIGERSDGAIIKSRNLSAQTIIPTGHAEARLARKSDVGTVVYIARVKRGDGLWGHARPCRSCRRIMKSRGIYQVYYTISHGEYGFMDLNKWVDDVTEKHGVRLAPTELGRWRRGCS